MAWLKMCGGTSLSKVIYENGEFKSTYNFGAYMAFSSNYGNVSGKIVNTSNGITVTTHVYAGPSATLNVDLQKFVGKTLKVTYVRLGGAEITKEFPIVSSAKTFGFGTSCGGGTNLDHRFYMGLSRLAVGESGYFEPNLINGYESSSTTSSSYNITMATIKKIWVE